MEPCQRAALLCCICPHINIPNHINTPSLDAEGRHDPPHTTRQEGRETPVCIMHQTIHEANYTNTSYHSSKASTTTCTSVDKEFVKEQGPGRTL